jgi:hypothetical protein
VVIRLAAGLLGWGKGSIGATAARRGAVMAGGASTESCNASMYLERGSQWLLSAPEHEPRCPEWGFSCSV